LLQLPAGFEAVDARHHDVKQYEVGLEAGVFLECGLARAGFGDLQTFGFKYARKYPNIQTIIVYQKNPAALLGMFGCNARLGCGHFNNTIGTSRLRMRGFY
jgi:hypothetical protein